MQFKCPYCDDPWIVGQEAYNQHLIEAHNLFKDSDKNITQETIAKLRSTMARCKWLLESYPATRGSDRLLVLQYLKIFEKHLCYNPKTKRIELRNREGLTYEDWLSITSFETITRCGRKVREQYPSLQPTEVTQAKREAREQAIQTNIKTASISNKAYKDIKEKLG